VRANSPEIDDEEWQGISTFLRKAYKVGDDMKVIAKTLDAEKKEIGKKLIVNFQQECKNADGAVVRKDPGGFVVNAKNIQGYLDVFTDLLSDVPDEI